MIRHRCARNLHLLRVAPYWCDYSLARLVVRRVPERASRQLPLIQPRFHQPAAEIARVKIIRMLIGGDLGVRPNQFDRPMQQSGTIFRRARLADFAAVLAPAGLLRWPAVHVEAIDLIARHHLAHDRRLQLRKAAAELAGVEHAGRSVLQVPAAVAPEPLRMRGEYRVVFLVHIGTHAAIDTQAALLRRGNALAEEVAAIQVWTARKEWNIGGIERDQRRYR